MLLALIVSASAIAQTKTDSTAVKTAHVIKGKRSAAVKVAAAAKDSTVYTLKFNTEQLNALMSALGDAYKMLPRSPDLTALQASEGQKGIEALGKIIAEQLPKQNTSVQK